MTTERWVIHEGDARFVGIEISTHYARTARDRLASLDAVGARASEEQPTLWSAAD